MIDELVFDDRGLVPAVVQHHVTGQLLMLAWMNREAVQKTLSTGRVHFFSRTRQALWQKGESSGNTLELVELRCDCDADAVLVSARPAGPTCHTGATSCFFRRAGGVPDDGPAGSVLDRLWSVMVERRGKTHAERSYVASLLEAGAERIADKIAEEQDELCAELSGGSEDAIIHEAADLVFHVMVGLLSRDVPISRVLGELARRFGVSGHDEKAARDK